MIPRDVYGSEDLSTYPRIHLYHVMNVDCDLETVYNWLDGFAFKYPHIVPFISRRGTFGVNTFLYMMLNGLAPVGISFDPYPAHSGALKESALATSDHDILHSTIYKKCLNTEIEDTSCGGVRKMYNYIMSHIDTLGEGKAKMFIFILFFKTHESRKSEQIMDNCVFGDPDFTIFFTTNSYYTPERYGYDSNNMDQYPLVDATGKPCDDDDFVKDELTGEYVTKKRYMHPAYLAALDEINRDFITDVVNVVG